MSDLIPENAVPGAKLSDFASAQHPLEDLANDRSGWTAIFEQARQQVRRFISCRDALEVLCKTATYRFVGEASVANSTDDTNDRIEQPDVEILHALVLMYGDSRNTVPTAPKGYQRIWPTISRTVFAFSRMQAYADSADNDLSHVVARVRMHTIYYRNPLGGQDCKKTMRNILCRVDETAQRDLGFRLSDAFELLLFLIDAVEERLKIFLDHLRVFAVGADEHGVERAIDALRTASPIAARLLRLADERDWDLKTRAWAAFQVCDVAHSWIYTFRRDDLIIKFGEPLIGFLDEITIPMGGLSGANADHIYMNNPVWARPLIGLPDGRLLFPEPYLPLSFPFRVFEPFLTKTSALKEVYERTRATFLEERTNEIVRQSLPSAKVYRSVEWVDPSGERRYENDVVAVLGNHIFLFEAKSGKLDDAGRRGAPASLRENLKELYIEPGEQAFRLQRYLAEHKGEAVLKGKDGTIIPISLDRPKIVHKYSVVMEHYAALTSGRRNYVALGLIEDSDAWAPVLSIGELEMLSRHLDTEISFFHYLARRSTIENLAIISGDEQDYLSLYLTNGFSLDFEALSGVGVAFSGLDAVVRGDKLPRTDRTEPLALGIPLSPYWKDFLKSIYNSRFPHRFDAIEVLLNQNPRALFEMERKIRKWRGRAPGTKNGETAMVHTKLGKRSFLVGVHFAKRGMTVEEWLDLARRISYIEGNKRVGATDCFTILVSKKSKDAFDAITFHRYIDPKDEITEIVGGTRFMIFGGNAT